MAKEVPDLTQLALIRWRTSPFDFGHFGLDLLSVPTCNLRFHVSEASSEPRMNSMKVMSNRVMHDQFLTTIKCTVSGCVVCRLLLVPCATVRMKREKEIITGSCLHHVFFHMFSSIWKLFGWQVSSFPTSTTEPAKAMCVCVRVMGICKRTYVSMQTIHATTSLSACFFNKLATLCGAAAAAVDLDCSRVLNLGCCRNAASKAAECCSPHHSRSKCWTDSAAPLSS